MLFKRQPKTPAPKACPFCGHVGFRLEQAGQHRKLSCAECGKYLKFVNLEQANDLQARNMIRE